ncbi:nitronate monooxygenase [Streptomyces paradoxus]|uniref:nitronate monooxygenase n=1 Tax=Streptomyces paradoxus TaxID=66375 RepID=UPI0036277A80
MSWPTGRAASVQLPDLVAADRHAVALPVIAAGGIATAADVTAVLRAGAVAAMVSTVLLRTRRADPTGAQAAAAALNCLRRTQPAGLGATRGLDASIPLRQSARGCPLRDQRRASIIRNPDTLSL